MSKLQSSAKELLYNDPGCFIVSQMLQEGIDHEDVALAASDFLAAAHDFPTKTSPTESELESIKGALLIGMKHKSANHAMKLWLHLLHMITRREQGYQAQHQMYQMHLSLFLQVVEQSVMDLACDVHG